MHLRTLLYPPESQLSSFHTLPHSLRKNTGGWGTSFKSNPFRSVVRFLAFLPSTFSFRPSTSFRSSLRLRASARSRLRFLPLQPRTNPPNLPRSLRLQTFSHQSPADTFHHQ